MKNRELKPGVLLRYVGPEQHIKCYRFFLGILHEQKETGLKIYKTLEHVSSVGWNGFSIECSVSGYLDVENTHWEVVERKP